MIFTEVLHLPTNGGDTTREQLVLPFEQRQKARQRARLESGADIGIQLPRGTVLRGGDTLRAPTGELVRVVAAPESVSTVVCDNPVLLARAAYHLGNRHVAVQIGPDWLRYLHDHVLDAMLRALGLSIAHALLPFEPEAGAYSHGQGHAHGARHDS